MVTKMFLLPISLHSTLVLPYPLNTMVCDTKLNCAFGIILYTPKILCDIFLRKGGKNQ